MSKLVYVVILNWNGWRDTLQCLESVYKTSYPYFRIIVADNGSTDESVERIQSAYPGVMVLENGKNLGFAGGNNPAITYALQQQAAYVWLLNNDTIVHSDALSALVRSAESDSKVGAAGSALHHMEAPDQVQAWGGGRVNPWLGTSCHFIAPVDEQELDYLTAASVLLRRAALEQAGLLDAAFFMYWEDTDLSFRFRKAGWKLAVSADSIVWHKESATVGRKSPALDAFFNQSAVRFFRRHSVFWPLPVLLGVGGRLVKRVLRRDWARARAVLKGALRS